MKLGPVICGVLAGAALYSAPARVAGDEVRIRDAAQHSLDLIQKTLANWKIPCMSCHHQGLGFMALDVARRHGIAVDESAAHAHAEKVFGQVAGLKAPR